MNLDPVEILSIDQRSIAKLLKLLSQGKNITCSMNKIMDNILWKLGHDPKMVLNGKAKNVDVVAISILDMNLFDRPFEYYVVEITESSDICYIDEDQPAAQFVGACICEGEEFTSKKISCYAFIDWLNDQDVFLDKYMKKITVVCALDNVVHIRIEI